MELVEKLAQFGVGGVALFLAYILWRLSDTVIKTFNNHMHHNTAALTKLECAIAKLCKIIDKK